MPSGITETATPSTWTPEPCAISQPSAPTRSPSRGVPWAPASVRNQPTTPTARQTRSVAGAAPAPPSRATSTSGRRCRASARPAAGRRGRAGQQRGHGPAIITRRPGPDRRSHAGSAPLSPVGYRGVRHEGPRRVRPVLQGRPRPPAAADLRLTGDLPASRARSATRSSRPGTTGARSPGSRTPRPGPGCAPARHAQRRHTATLWHREKDLDPEVTRHPRRPRQAAARASAGCCCSPSSRGRRWPRSPARSASPAPTPSASCRPRPRSSPSHRDVPTTSIRSALRAGGRQHLERRALAAALDHPPRRRRPAPYPHRGRGRRRRSPRWSSPARWSPTPPASARPSPATAPQARAEPSDRAAPEPAGPARGRAARARPGRSRRLPGTHAGPTVRTHDNTGGDGLVLTCQDEPVRRPRGTAALVRAFEPRRSGKQAPPPTSSRPPRPPRPTAAAAPRPTDTAARLVRRLRRRPGPAASTTRPSTGVGDEATLFVLRTWGRRLDAGRRRGPHRATHHDHVDPRHRPATQPTAGAVRAGCSATRSPACARSPDAGACAAVPQRPRVRAGAGRPRSPRCSSRSTCRRSPASPSPGSAPSPGSRGTNNAAATGCDDTDFSGQADDQQRHPHAS